MGTFTQELKLRPEKTYATAENARAAFNKKFGCTCLRYMILQDEKGRFFPVAIGQEAASLGVHFHFCVVG